MTIHAGELARREHAVYMTGKTVGIIAPPRKPCITRKTIIEPRPVAPGAHGA